MTELGETERLVNHEEPGGLDVQPKPLVRHFVLHTKKSLRLLIKCWTEFQVPLEVADVAEPLPARNNFGMLCYGCVVGRYH